MWLFERAAKLAYRQKTLLKDIKKTLAAAPLTELPPDPADRTEEEVTFPISTVTMFRNYTFLGRDQELKDIHGSLHSIKSGKEELGNDVPDTPLAAKKENSKSIKYGKSPACCILHGLGGIGKTQTALEYSYTFREEYDAIFWIRAELDSTLAETYAIIAKELAITKDIGGHEGKNQGQAIERARQWLKTTSIIIPYTS